MPSVKVIFQDEIRRFSVSDETAGNSGYEQLVKVTRQLFALPPQQDICFRYRDTEGDLVFLSSNEEFQEALNISKPPVRLEVCILGDNQQQQQQQQQQQLPPPQENVTSDVCQVPFAAEKQQQQTPLPQEKPIAEESSHSSSSCSQAQPEESQQQYQQQHHQYYQQHCQQHWVKICEFKTKKREIKEKIRQLKKQKREIKSNFKNVYSNPSLFDHSQRQNLFLEWKQKIFQIKGEIQSLKFELKSLKYQIRSEFKFKRLERRLGATPHDDHHHWKKYQKKWAGSTFGTPYPNPYSGCFKQRAYPTFEDSTGNISGASTSSFASAATTAGDHHQQQQQQQQEQFQARLVSDYPELSFVPCFPTSPVQRVWRVRNEGSSAWPEGTCLIQGWIKADHDKLQSPEKVPITALQPGDSADITVPLVAPKKIGIYRAVFRLSTPDGVKFGPRLIASVIVAN